MRRHRTRECKGLYGQGRRLPPMGLESVEDIRVLQACPRDLYLPPPGSALGPLLPFPAGRPLSFASPQQACWLRASTTWIRCLRSQTTSSTPTIATRSVSALSAPRPPRQPCSLDLHGSARDQVGW